MWDACGIPHHCHRLVSVNANEVSLTCTLWVPIFKVMSLVPSFREQEILNFMIGGGIANYPGSGSYPFKRYGCVSSINIVQINNLKILKRETFLNNLTKRFRLKKEQSCFL